MALATRRCCSLSLPQSPKTIRFTSSLGSSRIDHFATTGLEAGLDAGFDAATVVVAGFEAAEVVAGPTEDSRWNSAQAASTTRTASVVQSSVGRRCFIDWAGLSFAWWRRCRKW